MSWFDNPNNRPTNVRLGDLKIELMQEANERDMSLHSYLLMIIKERKAVVNARDYIDNLKGYLQELTENMNQ